MKLDNTYTLNQIAASAGVKPASLRPVLRQMKIEPIKPYGHSYHKEDGDRIIEHYDKKRLESWKADQKEQPSTDRPAVFYFNNSTLSEFDIRSKNWYHNIEQILKIDEYDYPVDQAKIMIDGSLSTSSFKELVSLIESQKVKRVYTVDRTLCIQAEVFQALCDDHDVLWLPFNEHPAKHLLKS